MSRYGHGDRMNSYSQYNNDRGRRQYRNAEEPEWFSGGPTSQNDTIELRGFEEYGSGRADSPNSQQSDEPDDDEKAAIAAEYDSDTDKAKGECGGDKSNDDNNNDNDKSGSNEDVHSYRETDADKNAANDFDADDIEVMGTVAASKSGKKDDNFNFEDFMKVDNLTDLLTVSVIDTQL